MQVCPVHRNKQSGVNRQAADQHCKQSAGHTEKINSIVAQKPVHALDVVFGLHQILHGPTDGGNTDVIGFKQTKNEGTAIYTKPSLRDKARALEFSEV